MKLIILLISIVSFSTLAETKLDLPKRIKLDQTPVRVYKRAKNVRDENLKDLKKYINMVESKKLTPYQETKVRSFIKKRWRMHKETFQVLYLKAKKKLVAHLKREKELESIYRDRIKNLKKRKWISVKRN